MKLLVVDAWLRGWRRIAGRVTALLLLSSACLFSAHHAAAQSQSLAVNRALVSSGVPAPPPTAPTQLLLPEQGGVTISLRPNELIALSSRRGTFGVVGVSPDQLVQITVQYPALQTGRPIVAEALDGGQIIGQTPMVVGLDHAIHFQFRAAHNSGVNHIALHDGSQEVGLQFWVLNAQHPEQNPPVVNPGN